MAVPHGKAAEREWQARELAQQRTRLSLRVGTLGIVLLFGCGLGIWLVPAAVLLFLGGMVVATLLLLAALLLVRGSVLSFQSEARRTKIL